MSVVTRRSAIALLGLAGISIPAVLRGQPLERHTDAQQPHMKAALEALRSAKRHLEEAEADKAGHRVKAIEHVDAAITETQAGIAAGAGH
ncbi:MAG TPA: hypothetical protein VFI79_17100 [Gemmatimonadales bacterium]|nr:hypothetical protein [Gemmatimonadales bacterium]